MNASLITTLRIALAYFWFVPLQRWLNWIFGSLLAIGLWAQMMSDSQADRFGWMVLATVAAVIVGIGPAFAGGGAMRAASTPTMMHLRPLGRRHMLTGAALAITLTALLMTLPMMLLQLSGAQVPIRNVDFHAPVRSMFQIVWGGTALSWVVVFAMSRYQMLAPLSFIVVVAIAGVIVRMADWLPVNADQAATGVCATGLAAWITFAARYMNAAAILVPRELPGWTGSQPMRELKRLKARWLGDREPRISRPFALFQYLVGSGSFRTQILVGGFFTAMLLFLPGFFTEGGEVRSPYQATGLGLVMMLITLVMAPRMVQRSRLLWLRAGLDRAALFATAERHARLSMLATLGVPLVVFLSLSLTQRPDLALNIMLFTVLQLTFAVCLLYAGFTATHRSAAASIVAGASLLLVFIVVSRSMEPDKELSSRAYLIALAIFGTLALVLRWNGRRKWLALDWRVAAGPLPLKGIR